MSATKTAAASEGKRKGESGAETKLTWRAGPTGSDCGWEAGELRTTRLRLAGGATPVRARREERSGLRRGTGRKQRKWATQGQAARERSGISAHGASEIF